MGRLLLKVKLVILALVVCLLFTACIKIEISVPDWNNSKTDSTQEAGGTEIPENVIYDYPDAIGTTEEKLLTPLLPDDVFESTAEENDLGGTLYQIYGTVTEITSGSNGNMSVIYLHTHQGDIVISNIALSMAADSSFGELGELNLEKVKAMCPMPKEGEFCCIFAEYQGFSEKYKAPFFIYGGEAYMTHVVIEALE